MTEQPDTAAALREKDALIAQQAATIEASHEHYSFTADELLAVAGAIGSTRFMDPPDGGDVTLAEQVKRMSAALTAAEAERDRAREALEAAKGWLEGWASAERELAVIDAALSTAKGLGE